jgi:hypothetical protein
MNKRFLFAALASTITVLLINGGIYPLFYGDFIKNYSNLSADIWDKVQKPVAETDIFASILAVLLIGILITSVVRWTKAKSFLAGIKSGFILGVLMVGGVDLGLIATTKYFSYTSGIIDIFVAAFSFALAGGVAASIFGRENTRQSQ